MALDLLYVSCQGIHLFPHRFCGKKQIEEFCSLYHFMAWLVLASLSWQLWSIPEIDQVWCMDQISTTLSFCKSSLIGAELTHISYGCFHYIMA